MYIKERNNHFSFLYSTTNMRAFSTVFIIAAFTLTGYFIKNVRSTQIFIQKVLSFSQCLSYAPTGSYV